MTGISRRSAGLGMAAIAISSLYDGARAQVESITLPFGNGAYRLSPAMCSWNRRRSSHVAVPGERLRNAANRLQL